VPLLSARADDVAKQTARLLHRTVDCFGFEKIL
jgi:hypothetical protein